LWKNFFEPAGESMRAMATEIGKNDVYVSQTVAAHERRTKMKLDNVDVTTDDFKHVRGLDDKTAEKVLKAKAAGDLEAQEVRKIAPVLRETKPEKRAAVIDKVVKEHRAAEQYKEDVREEARAFGSGEVESTGVKVVKSADIKRVDKFKDIHDDILWWRLVTIEAIENDVQRNEVIGFVDAIREHCEGLVAQAAKRDWYAKKK
jgi:hypothetical protein